MALGKITRGGARFAFFTLVECGVHALVALWANRQERQRKREERRTNKRQRKAIRKIAKRLEAHAAAINMLLQAQQQQHEEAPDDTEDE